MSIERSQGKPRPRTPRRGSDPLPASAVTPVPLRDVRSGKFVKGNQAGKLKRLKSARRLGFIGLDPRRCIAWLAPFIELARTDAGRLIEETGAIHSPSLVGLAEDTANARAFLRGLLHLASQGDVAARKEALLWMREYRQNVLTLRAEARADLRTRDTVPMGMTALQSSIIAERHARRAQAARDASDGPSGPRVDPEPKDAPEGNVAQARAIREDEPPRAVRIHEGEDDRPVRVAARVGREADARDVERAERSFGLGNTSSLSVPDSEIAPALTPKERARIANIERNKLLGLCEHSMNARSCPQCVMSEQQRALAARHAQRKALR